VAIDDKSVEQFLGYYSFWLFEYTKRNHGFCEKKEAERLTLNKYQSIRKDLKDTRIQLSKMIRPDRTWDPAHSDEILRVMKKIEGQLQTLDTPLSVDEFISEVKDVSTMRDYPWGPLLNEKIQQMSSSDIVLAITETGGISSCASIDYPPSLLYSAIDYRHDWSSVKESTSVKERFLSLNIDTDCDIELVMKEIKSAHWDKICHRGALSALEKAKAALDLTDGTKVPDEEAEKFLPKDYADWLEKNRKLKKDLICYKIKKMIQDRGRGFDLDDTPRAIGLWLWDYITNQYRECKPPHRAYADAMRAFKEKFDCEKLGYAATESGTYRNWYHRTAACIEACDVLSFKGDGRKKKTKA